MLLRWARYRNIGPFKDFRLDVESLRGIVAICAPNGTGKTFSLEAALLGAPYLKLETQGTLVGRATDRDASVEAGITYGFPFTVKQVVDGVSRTSESLLLDDAGTSLTNDDTKVTTYKAWAAKHLPDRDVYLAGPFGAQKSEGFVAMQSGDRIALILRVLGVAKLERAAALARARAGKAEERFTALVERAKEARGDVPSGDAAALALEAARAASEAADAEVTRTKVALAEAQTAAAAHAVRQAERDASAKLQASLREQQATTQARLAKAREALINNQTVQREAEGIRAAAARLESENSALTQLELALAEAEKAIRAELDPWRDGAARVQAAERRAGAARMRLRDEEAVLAALRERATLAAAVEAERAAVVALAGELADLEAKVWASDKQRAAALRAGVDEIAALSPDYHVGHDDPWLGPRMAGSLAQSDDLVVTRAIETPKQLTELKARLRRERDHLASAERTLAEAERLAGRLGEIEAANADLAAGVAEAAELRQGHALAVLSAFARAVGRLETQAAARGAGAALEVTRKQTGRLPRLEASEARIAELDREISADVAALAHIEQQLAGIQLEDLGKAPDVAELAAALESAESTAKKRAAEQVRAEQTLARARQVDAKVAEIEAERELVAGKLANWNRLEMDLGRKGIQSALVDSAGPELTALANDLLHTCHSTRFTVEVKTQRLDAKGKGLVDECTVRVIDSLKGTEKELREHSGGERVLLGEAMSLALTMMGCRRAGFSDFTIVRDESGAALDADNNRAYVAMLRRALDITGARHVLLVSHSEAVQKMCDHVVRIPEAA